MRKINLALFILLLSSCAQKPEQSVSNALYFDIDGYFNSEIKRLSKVNPKISKTVFVKNEGEHKVIQIRDWKAELAVFKEADINKSSWSGEFNVKHQANLTSYTTANANIATKKVVIERTNEKISAVKIFKATDNYLYTSADTLFYYPDSLYLITSYQKVKLLSAKNYSATGVIVK